MRNRILAALACAGLGVGLAGCPVPGPKPVPTKTQGWTDDQRSWWYDVTQGSRLLPLSWAKSLELPDSTIKVFSDGNLGSLNYITDHNKSGLPIGFVVDVNTNDTDLSGAKLTYPTMAANGDLKKPWFGMNCSACHTNDIAYQGHKVRVDGSQTLGDFQSMLDEMLGGLKQTNTDNAKFERFAAAVIGGAPSDAQKQTLKAELAEVIAWEQPLADKNDGRTAVDPNAHAVRYGFGRLDAQGHILNKVEMLVVLGLHPADIQNQVNFQPPTPSNAPASYPFIWDAPIENDIQYNEIVSNSPKYTIRGEVTNIGALGRNIGEVIGVFGQVDALRQTTLQGYNSTVNIRHLIEMERTLTALDPPKWPEWLTPLDPALTALGKTIYWGGTDSATGKSYKNPLSGNCAACHDDKSNVRNADGKYTSITVSQQTLADSGTDIWLSCNTYLDTANTGSLNGRGVTPFSSTKFGVTAKVAQMLTHTAVGSIVGDANKLIDSAWQDLTRPFSISGVRAQENGPKVDYLPGITDKYRKGQAYQCLSPPHADALAAKLLYRSRPLDGIWATAPYLHNGSVPTLYDLLLPATVKNMSTDKTPPPVTCDRDGTDKTCVRPEDFSVGSHEFDPKLVGFVSTPNLPNTFEFHVRDTTGTPVLGNYNSGHYFGVALNDHERWALIEYLKSL